jgi:hypothetical protein
MIQLFGLVSRQPAYLFFIFLVGVVVGDTYDLLNKDELVRLVYMMYSLSPPTPSAVG